MRSLLSLFLVFLIVGCEVNTDSSSRSASSGTSTGTDDNSTDGGDTGDGDTDSGIIVDSLSDDFDSNDAEKDSNACLDDGTYNRLTDSVFDPVYNSDDENGIQISSMLPSDPDVHEITIYYPDLTLEKTQVWVNVTSPDEYRFSFDQIWIDNDDNRIYILVPTVSYRKPSCYRYELNSPSADGIEKVKVYR